MNHTPNFGAVIAGFSTVLGLEAWTLTDIDLGSKIVIQIVVGILTSIYIFHKIKQIKRS